MRSIIIAFFAIMIHEVVYACPVCERNKTKAQQLISAHGSSPESNWDYVIVIVIVIIAILSLFYSVKWLIKPNENNKDHIKYSILKPE